MSHFLHPLSQSCDSFFWPIRSDAKFPLSPVVLQNAIAPAQPAAPRAVPKPARKAPAKPGPRPEQATKPGPRPERATMPVTGPDQNKKPSEGAAGGTSSSSAHKSKKKVVNTLTTVLSARSKVSDETIISATLASLVLTSVT
jgi:hypothetical protein